MKPRQHPTHPPFEPAEAEIQKQAYFLWQEEGCPSGRDLEIWLTAKEMIRHRPPHAPSPVRRAASSLTRAPLQH